MAVSREARAQSAGLSIPVGEILPRKVSAPGFVRRADRATGWLVIACTGTGCAFRVPIIYPEAVLKALGW